MVSNASIPSTLLLGWAFNELSKAANTLDLAVEIIETFATSTQGEVFHDSPKTLGVIDTSLFEPFLTRWEALCAAMKA